MKTSTKMTLAAALMLSGMGLAASPAMASCTGLGACDVPPPPPPPPPVTPVQPGGGAGGNGGAGGSAVAGASASSASQAAGGAGGSTGPIKIEGSTFVQAPSFSGGICTGGLSGGIGVKGVGLSLGGFGPKDSCITKLTDAYVFPATISALNGLVAEAKNDCDGPLAQAASDRRNDVLKVERVTIKLPAKCFEQAASVEEAVPAVEAMPSQEVGPAPAVRRRGDSPAPEAK